MQKTFLTLFIISSLISCSEQSNKSNVSIVYAKSQDPELEQARKDALSNLDDLITSFNTHSNDTIYQYSLKADFIDNEKHEHMWIKLNKINNEEFQGFLANNPQIVKNVKNGDLVKITKNQIEDWLIIDTKTNNWEGDYSIKVLQKRQKK